MPPRLPFPGLTVDDTSGGPADPWLAVGPEHIVQVIDTAILVQDRAAHIPTIADLGNADLFDLPDGWGSGYPRVLFDSAPVALADEPDELDLRRRR